MPSCQHIRCEPLSECRWAAYDQPITGLTTLQFAYGGMFDSAPEYVGGYDIHLVRSAAGHGTPGPTLCDIDRFAEGCPGWSVGGGVSGPAYVHKPCPACAQVAREHYPGLPVSGSVGRKEMAALIASLAAPAERETADA